MIDPKKLITDLSIEELCGTAEKYYKNIPTPENLFSKPYNSIKETPELLYNLSLLLAGLQVGKSMTVLDFGSGVCWLSKLLNEMKLCTISVDCSETAINIGKDLFGKYPTINKPIKEPVFLKYNGHILDLPDESVDRIICFDVFHHIPNQKEIINEFCRILKPGGIVGFSEPGINHSQTPMSQQEMQNYNVLENDISLCEIWDIARTAGFTKTLCKLMQNPYFSIEIEDYTSVIKGSIPEHVTNSIIEPMKHNTIFFLYKGDFIYDSRMSFGLSHEMFYENNLLTIKNTGIAKWLCNNINDIGVVKLAAHKYSKDMQLIDFDYLRIRLEKDILPGEQIKIKIDTFQDDCILLFDMVSEDVSWFEALGSNTYRVKYPIDE
jgi:ubiquinone/menaquinone biosynthesis C-methylase UbiE